MIVSSFKKINIKDHQKNAKTIKSRMNKIQCKHSEDMNPCAITKG